MIIRAANTGVILGFRLGWVGVHSCSKGTIDAYRNGWQVRFRRREVAFIARSGWRSLSDADLR